MKMKDIGEMDFNEHCPLGKRTSGTFFLYIFLLALLAVITTGFIWACWTWTYDTVFDPTSIFDLLVVIFYITSILLIGSMIIVVFAVRKHQCKKDEMKEKKKKK